ncbi:alpha/beta fold hydrolase [Marinicauda pacifica]|uniref:alpha/beta fold hydrolase n=1 Tax=Marinicauda pacifica TaxID=1133559 RepID=UPI0035C7BE18
MTATSRSTVMLANAAAFITPQTFQRRAVSQFVTPRVRSQTERGREILDTLRAETFQGPVGRQRAYVGGDGPAVLFQHGWEADSADLATHADALLQSGFKVVLIDGPAHGQSEGRKAMMPEFAAGLAAAADTYGQPFAVVAHSMGTPSAVIAMSRHGLSPDRFVSLGAPRSLPENVRFHGRSAGLSHRAVRLMLEGLERRFGEPIDHFDVARDAPSMTARALFVHGTGDQIARAASSTEIARVWPGAELELYEGLGHRGVLRDARVIERVRTFLS